jgi:O-antigen ligase
MILNKYLIYSLPFALITGPFIPEIVLLCLCLNFLLISFQKKITYYYFNNFSKIFFLFYIIINISSLFSDNIIYSLKTSIPYIRYYFLIIIFSYLVKNYKNFLLNFFYVLLISIFIVSVSGYLEFFFDITFSFKPDYIKQESRVSGIFGSELIIGSYISRLLPLLFLITVYLKKKNKFYFFIYLFFYSTVVLSGERTSLLFATISFLFFIFFFNQDLKSKFFYLSITILFVCTIFSFNPILEKRFFYETKKQITFENKFQYFSKEHSHHFNTAFKMFIDKPLLGHGPRSFRIICSDKKYYENLNSCSTHPHNTLLQLLAETGLFGSFFFIFIFIYSNYLLFKNIILKRFNRIFVFLPLLIIFFPFSPNGNFFNNWLSIVNYLSLSLSLHLLLISEKKN